jgi:NifU-like protein involved in Fe-S cluster formation
MKKVNISQVDALFSKGSYPIELLLYYQDGFDTKKLRAALRDLSSAFWPVFGEYRDGAIVFEKYSEQDFYAEESAGHELDIREIEQGGYEVYSRFGLPNLKKLFFLKAIRLKDGLVLIPKLNHLAGDGYSYFYFLSVLAALSRPAAVPFKSSLTKLFFKPHHRRTILKDFSFRGVELKPALQAEKFIVEFVQVPRADVQAIIRDVSTSANLRVSSNDILSAIAIKILAGKQGEFWGEEISLTIPIDVRRQVKEYGRAFFGNGIMLHSTKLNKEFIKNSMAKDIAVQIRKSMPIVSKETYIRYLTELEDIIAEGEMDKFKVYDPGSGGLVTNLSKLPADKLDFGTGGPDLIIPLTIEKNSTGILAKNENYVLRFAY